MSFGKYALGNGLLVALTSLAVVSTPGVALSQTAPVTPAASASTAAADAPKIVVIDGTLGNSEVDVVELPSGFTKNNCTLLSATVTDTMPPSVCKTGHCTYRKNLLSNNPITSYNFEGYGDAYGVRLAYLSTDTDEVVIHHKELVMVPAGPSGSTRETRPVYQGLPYRIILMKVSAD